MMSGRERRGARALGALVAAIALSGCVADMYDQHRLKPLRASDFHADGRSARDPVPGTVPRGGLKRDLHLHKGTAGGQPVATFPFRVDRRVLERGRERFTIYCTPCHGHDGRGNGMIVQKGFKMPPSFHEPRLRDAPPGHFFDVMTRGFGTMYDFSHQLQAPDRWAVAAYVRALQLSQHARVSGLRADERQRLEAMR
jgi:hypothetical protein